MDAPIHTWNGSGHRVTVYRKTSLFGNAAIVTLIIGAGDYAYDQLSKYPVSLAEIANSICEMLESKWEETADVPD